MALAYIMIRNGFGPLDIAPFIWAVAAVTGGWIMASAKGRNHVMRTRFKYPRFAHLAQVARERYDQLCQDLKRAKSLDAPEVSRLLPILSQVLDTVVVSLRQADAVMLEVAHTERPSFEDPVYRPPVDAHHRDSQVQELYQMADRNLAEYRKSLERLTRSVKRTEAQAEVYITTVDVLRARVLSLRLGAVDAGGKHSEFIYALNQAKAQLEDVDRSLRELDFAREMAMDLERELEDMVQRPGKETLEKEMLGRSQPPPIPTSEERERY